jgi:hypothetical protein
LYHECNNDNMYVVTKFNACGQILFARFREEDVLAGSLQLGSSIESGGGGGGTGEAESALKCVVKSRHGMTNAAAYR